MSARNHTRRKTFLARVSHDTFFEYMCKKIRDLGTFKSCDEETKIPPSYRNSTVNVAACKFDWCTINVEFTTR